MPNPSSVHDLIIRNGIIIDGTRGHRFVISAHGDLETQSAKTEIDAGGHVIAPGFIDCHTHDDVAVLADPDMAAKITQGVTTVITGNCGISLAPLKAGQALPMPLGLLAGTNGAQIDGFARLIAYFKALEKCPAATNVASLVGHTNLRVMAMADLNREANADEIILMRAALEIALRDGALGVSTGTYYPPAAAATMRELIEVCAPLSELGGVFATHMRDEADGVMESLDEVFAIGKALGVRVIISHHKVQRERNFGKSSQTLPKIADAMTHQCVDEERLQGKVVIASSDTFPEKIGQELSVIAADWGVSLGEASARLAPASAVYFSMHEDDVRAILAFDQTMIGSDGLPGGPAPHPRLWGTFPRVLGHYCREVELFDLETAVWKMTGLPAANFGLAGRGALKVGNAADIVVLDPLLIIDRATYLTPVAPSEGIKYVIVNGVITLADGAPNGARSGQVIRRQSSNNSSIAD
jgi:N-acyl-D-amino-acid deacylase